MGNTIGARVIHMHDIEATWNMIPEFIPKCGEIIIYDKDSIHKNARFKIGDGITKLIELPFGASDLEELIEWEEDIGYIDAGKISSYN